MRRRALRAALTAALVVPLLGAAPAPAPKPAAAKPAAAPAKPRPAPSSPAKKAAAPKPQAKQGDPWALLLAGQSAAAAPLFAARLDARPADLASAIGLATVLDARNDAGGAANALARALAAADPRDADVPGATAGLALLLPRAPDAGATAIPLLERLAGPKAVAAHPELRTLAAQSLLAAQLRSGHAGTAFGGATGPGGTITEWSLIGPYGRFDRLDLLRPFPPETGDFDPAAAKARDGLPAFRIDTTFADGRLVVPPQFRTTGVVYAIADVVATRPVTVRLSASSPASFRVFVDGQLALTADRVREHPAEELAARVTLSAARHRLLVKLANGSRFAALALALEPADPGASLGDALKYERFGAGPLGTAEIAPWPALLDTVAPINPATPPATAIAACWWLRARGLDERLGTTLQEVRAVWPKAPVLAAFYGEWALGARTGKSADEDLAQARALLSEAAAGDPGQVRARLLLARMDENATQLNEAWNAAEAVLKTSPEDPDALALQHRIAVKRGWNVEADRRIERARAAAHGRGDLLDAAIEYYRKSGSGKRLEAALKEKRDRDPFDEGWAEYLTNAGRIEEARAAWESVLALRPSSLYPYIGLARLYADAGDPARALGYLDAAARIYPTESFIPFKRAGVLAMQGKEAEATAELRHALELDPSRIEIWESLFRRGEKDLLSPWLGNAKEILKDAPKPERGSDSALLADIASVLIDPQGGQTELYQGVHAVYTRAGVEREGELDVLPGARVQGIRIHKPDGRYADVQVGDKRPVSLPGLEPGDSIEYVWRRYIPAYEPVPGSLDNRTLFLFQGQDREYVLSRYVIAHDKRLPVEACGNFTSLTQTDQVEGPYRVRSWTARQMPRLVPEPHMADPLEIIPNVRLGLDLTWTDIGDLVKSALAGMLQPDAPLPGFAADIRKLAGSDDPLALVRALHTVVRDRIRPGSQALTIGVPASVSASAGEGNRTAVALALAQMLKLPARLVLARPIEQKGRQLDCPSPLAFSYALVEVALPDRTVYLDYSEADHPFDVFPARLAGTDGLRVPLGLDEPAQLVTLPRRETGVLEETESDVTMDGDGRVSGSMVLTTRGAVGAVLRRVLRELPADQRPNVFRQVANDAFPGASIDDAQVIGQDEPESELKLAIRFSGGSWGRRTPTGLALPVVTHPLGLFTEFATLPVRSYALLLDAQEYRRDVVHLAYPDGMLPVEVPPPVTRGEKFGGYSLLVKREPGHLTAVRNAIIPAGRIEPADYPAFRDFARTIDEAESREVQLTVTSPSLSR